MASAAPVVYLVSTPLVPPGATEPIGFVRRWLKAPERELEARRDFSEGRANGVAKELQALTEAQARALSNAKHRLAALAEAGLEP